MLCRNDAHEVEVSDGEQGGEGRKLKVRSTWREVWPE